MSSFWRLAGSREAWPEARMLRKQAGCDIHVLSVRLDANQRS